MDHATSFAQLTQNLVARLMNLVLWIKEFHSLIQSTRFMVHTKNSSFGYILSMKALTSLCMLDFLR